jgi:hypothetical protein
VSVPKVCTSCNARLSGWEADQCACTPKSYTLTNGDIAYAIAASSPAPLHLRDFVRLADVDYDKTMSQATANATIAPDPRFCWAGKGLYGLLRHGPLPGPRNLEEASRLLLCASDRALTLEAVDFCLKRLNYRFTTASLHNAISRSTTIEWRWPDGHFHVPQSPERDAQLLRDVPVLPPGPRDDWTGLKMFIRSVVDRTLAQRTERLRNAAIRTIVRDDWD